MKKFVTLLCVFLITFTFFLPDVSATRFEGFSIDFPSNFDGEYTVVDSTVKSDFFTQRLAYEAESDFEMMSLLVGKSKSLDTLFTANFGFAERKDLDLSLLTEKQLAEQAERLTAYIDMTFPLYMTYLTPKSLMVDDRLGLVVTGYYTDYNGGLTGQFRAYEFYYMGQLIIIYYDTQIEGTYFAEDVLVLPDSIVSTLDFEQNPAIVPLNSLMFENAVKTAAPVLAALLVAVLLGVLLGLLFKKRPTDNTNYTDALLIPKPPSNIKQDDSIIIETGEIATIPKTIVANQSSTEDEAVDWNTMLSNLKQKDATKTQDEPARAIPIKAPLQQTKPALSASKKADLQASIDAMDAMSREISATMEVLDREVASTDMLKNETKKAAPTKTSAKMPKVEAKKKETAPVVPKAPPQPKSLRSKDVTTSYEDYMVSILPQKHKTSPNTAQAKAQLFKSDEPKIKLNEEIDDAFNAAIAEKQKKTKTKKAERPEKQGILYKALSNIAEKIEHDDDLDLEPEFDSRSEMHISEKTEKNSVEKLMPGLFDDAPEEESIEILLDQSEDIKFENNKNQTARAKKNTTTKEKAQVESRLNSLFSGDKDDKA